VGITTAVSGRGISSSAGTLLAALALALVAASGGAEKSGAGIGGPRPNVVVFMTDDQTVASLRVMSNVRRLLAAQGTTFTNAFASFPTCCPSRATFLTGQYAHNHGVMSNHPPRGGSQALDHANTLAVWLHAAGYRTAHLGKYLNGYGHDQTPPLPTGWTEWYGALDPTTYRFFDYSLNENGRSVRYGEDAGSYQTDVYARKASDLVRRLAARPEPFFLFVGFLAPHVGAPRDPDDPELSTPSPAPRHRDAFASESLPRPPSFNEADVSDKPPRVRARGRLTPEQIAEVTEKYQQRLESLLAVDEAVSRVMRALQTARVLGRTLVVFTSDNGFMHGEHRYRHGKVVPYEPSIRVPLILRGPGVARNRVQPDPVTNVDLAATIADVAGAYPLRLLDGRSLMPLATDPGRRFGRDVLLETASYVAIRTPRYKYVQHKLGARELYDLERDPHELRSRHADPALAAVRTDLAARLGRLRNCLGDACAPPPRLRLAVGGLDGDGCVEAASAAARVDGPDAARVARAEFRLAARRLAVRRGEPFAAGIAASRLSSEPALLRVAVRLRDGREVTLDRELRSC
jgi:N-acetylglucosamine-6-sulfatase